MALLISEQMRKRKEQKFRRELKRALSEMPSKVLQNYIGQWFEKFKNQPSADDFVEMAMASKFGLGNAINNGGVAFLFEASFKVFTDNNSINSLEKAAIQPWGSKHLLMFNSAPIWNGAFLLEADAKLLPHIGNIQPNEFSWEQDISPYLFLDKETHAFGFLIVPMPAMKLEDFITYGQADVDGWEDGVVDYFEKKDFCNFQLNDYDTGTMDFISPVHVIFGPVDKLLRLLPERKSHTVSPHNRTYKSGKIASVSGHSRRNALKLVVNKKELTDHIVYEVRDCEGVIRYFGEGKSDRWKHVNSGVSHNRKINEHFFTKGEMSVFIAYDGLTKSEALSIEKLLIRNAPENVLWNIKDYEPFRSSAESVMSEEELMEISHN